jgi:plastocyanin
MRKPGANLKIGIAMFLVVFAISVPSLYALNQLVQTEDAAAVADGGDEVIPGGPVNVTVVARNLVFDKRSIAASPGASVTVTLVNEDAGVTHNISFYTNNRATTAIEVGPLFPGVATQAMQFEAPASAGNYFFRCDAHPDTMTGSFAVR